MRVIEIALLFALLAGCRHTPSGVRCEGPSTAGVLAACDAAGNEQPLPDEVSKSTASAEGISLVVEADSRYRVRSEMLVSITLHNNRERFVLIPQRDPPDQTYRIEVRSRSGLHVLRKDLRDTGRGHGFARVEPGKHQTQTEDLNAIFKIDKPGEYLLSVVGTIIPDPSSLMKLQAPDVPFTVEADPVR